MNRVAVVVLNWNGASMLPDCVESLMAQDHSDFFVVVVDNDSKDNSRAVLSALSKKAGDKLQVIYHSKNSGFAGGVNIGIRHSLAGGATAIALFNNDATAAPDWLRQLATVLEDEPTVGIATGLLLHADGKTIDSTGDFYSIWGLAFPRNRDEAAANAPDSGFVFGATGGASLYRAEVFKQVGYFDEAFFAYYEDVDISFRAQLAGWKVYYTKAAVAYHRQGATSERIPGFTKYQMFKNLPMLYWKNVPSGLMWRIGWRFKLIYSLMYVNAILQGAFLPATKGLLVTLFRFPATIASRRTVQRLRRRSSDYIESMIYRDLPPNQKGKLRKLARAR